MRIGMVAAALSAMLPMGCTQQTHPELVSNVPSIRIALAGDDGLGDLETPHCSVVMHNLSSRGVIAYVLDDGGDSKGGIAMSREACSTVDHPLIAPRSDSQKELFTFGQARRTMPRI